MNWLEELIIFVSIFVVIVIIVAIIIYRNNLKYLKERGETVIDGKIVKVRKDGTYEEVKNEKFKLRSFK